MREIWSINPFLVVTQTTDFLSLICFTSILGHAFSRIDYYVNALIERYIASYCRWIKGVDGLLAQNIFKTRRFVILLTTMKSTFLLFNIVKCYVSARAELLHKRRCPIEV